MLLKTLSLHSFRNYNDLSLNFSDRINILYGENGIGKTNILEAIFMLGNGISFKTRRDKEILNYESSSYSLRGVFSSENKAYNSTVDIIYQNNTKHILIDKKHVKYRKEIIGKVLYILFLPSDTNIVLGEPKVRRDYFNMLISTLSENYLTTLIKYTKLLKMRNILIVKNSYDANMYNEDIAKYGIILSNECEKYASLVKDKMNSVFDEIFGTACPYDIKYVSSISDIKDEESYVKKLESTFQTQMKMKTTFFGPHRSDYIFSYKQNNSKKFSSQGENRMFTLILKLASEYVISEIKKTSPILLIDDAMLELDNLKREKILDYIKTKGQVFITVTEKEKLRNFDDGLSFDIFSMLKKEETHN